MFDKTAPLAEEFNSLYASLFDEHERHLEVIRLLRAEQQLSDPDPDCHLFKERRHDGRGQLLPDEQRAAGKPGLHTFQWVQLWNRSAAQPAGDNEYGVHGGNDGLRTRSCKGYLLRDAAA